MRKQWKNLFDANTTIMQIEGQEFKTGQISDDLAARYERFRNQIQGVEDKASVPCLVSIIKFILNLVWICILGGLLQACADGTSWKRMYQNASGLFYVGGGAFVLWLLLFIYEMAKKNKAYGDADLESMKHQAKSMEEQLRMELDIPVEAQLVDVIHQCYEMKKGKKKVVHAMLYAFINQEMYVWRKEDRLCFCDRTELYEIPVACFGETELWKKPVQVSGWNKDEAMDDKKFKEFKPYQTNAGIFVKQHYMLRVRGKAEEFVIRIPNYDFTALQNLIKERQ